MRKFLPLLLLLTAVPARAEQALLLPATSQVQIRTFGLGFFPLDGNFARFTGWIRYDPARPAVCQVSLQVEAASLTMSDQSVRDKILGPEFMNVSVYPDLAFNGVCQNNAIAGTLTLHGETHPFILDVTRAPAGLTAIGRLRRGDWGMTTRSLTAGSTIRIRVAAPNPFPVDPLPSGPLPTGPLPTGPRN